MTVSFLLRLVPDELRRGQLVGRLRVVATGEERTFRNAGELAIAAADVLPCEPREDPGRPDGPREEGPSSLR